MTDPQPQNQEPENSPPENRPPENRPPVILIPRSVFYVVGLIVVGSFVLTLFVRNPYTQATQGDYYERNPAEGPLLWVAIFIGIPAAWYAYKNWIAPLLKRK